MTNIRFVVARKNISRLILATLFTFSCCNSLMSQSSYIISGVICDQSGVPVEHVSVKIAESSALVYSNAQGKYSILTSQGECTLLLTSVWFKAQKLKIKLSDNKANVNFTLEPTTFSLGEVVVTGTGTSHKLKDAPVQTDVITGRKLKEYAGLNIEDVMGGLSSSLTFNPNDMGSNIQLNGLKNDYILVLKDGKRINGDVGGQNDLSKINMQNIERIEIVKGASSSLYGSDAIGGVINFISKKNEEKLIITNASRVGAYGDLNQNNEFSFMHGKWNSTTTFDLNHTNGWKNTNREWYRSKLVENSVTRTVNRSTNYGVSENLAYQINKSFKWTADLSFYEKWTHRPTGIPLWRLNDFYYRDQSYATGGKYDFKNKNYLTLNVSFDKSDYYYDYTSREYTDYFDQNGARIVYYTGDRIQQSSQSRWLADTKGIFHLNEQHCLSVGVELLREELLSPFRLKNDRAYSYTLASYVQDEWNPTKKLNFTAGLRWSEHKAFGTTLTPKVSLLYKLKRLNLRATYSNGFKAPTIKELYYDYYSTFMTKLKAYYGDVNLKPQTSNYFAIGAEYNTSLLKVSITSYYNQINQIISLQHTATSYEDKLLLVEETMHYVNLAKGRTSGVDMSLDLNLPLDIKTGIGYSYLNAKEQRTDDEDAVDYMKYVNMNGTSRHNITIRTSWSHSFKAYKLGLSLNGKFQSKRFYISDGNTNAYQLWRINSSHALINKKKWNMDMNIGVDNIFNYIDRTPFGCNRVTTNPGRTLYTSLIFKFKNTKN